MKLNGDYLQKELRGRSRSRWPSNELQTCLLGLPWQYSALTLPSNAGVVGSVPGQGTNITQASWPKQQKTKQKQNKTKQKKKYYNKFNKDLKKYRVFLFFNSLWMNCVPYMNDQMIPHFQPSLCFQILQNNPVSLHSLCKSCTW